MVSIMKETNLTKKPWKEDEDDKNEEIPSLGIIKGDINRIEEPMIIFCPEED